MIKRRDVLADDTMFTPAEKKYLIDVARHALEEEIAGKASAPAPAPFVSPALARKTGAFVTLLEGHALRGCLGMLSAESPLPQTIDEMARRAGTEDPRFDPVSKQELDMLSIELSILSPFTKIAGPDAIEIGRDGLLVTLGRSRGLLLPQVAEKYHFTPEEFLEETCVKAGLPRQAWKLEEAEVFSFRAEVIEEGEV